MQLSSGVDTGLVPQTSLRFTDNEVLLWQGKPAPRCFVFRNWKHSIFGLLFLLVTSYWQFLALQVAADYGWPWMVWFPVPFVLTGFYLGVGHHLLARLEWDRVLYRVSDRRLLVQRGLFKPRWAELPLAAVSYFRLDYHGQDLGTLRVYGAEQDPVLVLHCIEYPRHVTDLLEDAMPNQAKQKSTS